MKNFGKLIYGNGPLSALSPAAVRAAVSQHGFVLLRGFSANDTDFETFCHNIVPRSVVVAGRRAATSSGLVHFADDNQDLILLHAENSFSPLRPDIAFFFCKHPPEEDGQTTVGDGVQLLALLPKEIERMLMGTRLRWTGRIRREALEQMYGRSDRGFVEGLARLISSSMDPELERFDSNVDGDVILYSYESMAVNRSVRGLAYADSCTNFTGPEPTEFGVSMKTARIAFADGTSFTDEMRKEIEAVKDGIAAIPVAWTKSDVLIMDNWSVMHGRNSFWGGREILCYFGYADWLRPPGRAQIEDGATSRLAAS
jgi:alpha-ketoglutarate-dependent taurine dioxygenase